jgi:hypothetical protein
VKRILCSIALLHVTLFAHSMHVSEPMSETLINYGIFADALYRDRDLYPYGVEGSAGFENHGLTKEVTLNHIGAFVEGAYAYMRYGAELNRHAGAPNTFDGLIEKLYGGIGSESALLVGGREANHISFVRTKAWGYGFAAMPLAVESFFDGTYYGDGLFGDYRLRSWRFGADVMNDRYTKTPRVTLSLAWQGEALGLLAYAQWRDVSQVRSDYSSIKHTHTHGSGCNNLSQNERCIERDSQVVGVGGTFDDDALSLQGEYLLLHTEGEIFNNRYKVASNNTIHTIYLQAIYAWEYVDIGLRSEGFLFSNRYEGDGAQEIASLMDTQYRNDVQYLNTLMIALKPYKGNRAVFQAENSQDGWAWRVAYSVAWSSH